MRLRSDKAMAAAAAARSELAMRNQGDVQVSEFVLRLYIAGSSAPARRAEQQVRNLQARLKHKWKVEVIDVLVKPELAERPTFWRRRRSLTNIQNVRVGLSATSATQKRS